jgi:hypothetical protein
MWSSKPALAALLVAVSMPAAAAEDLRALEVQGQRGQSLEQTRRDRYECHNWAVEQTGEMPAAVPQAGGESPSSTDRELRRERIDRAIVGAAIGGAIGGILSDGWRRHANDRVLAGAAAGAAIGAATTLGSPRRGTTRSGREAAEARAEEPSDYLRALTACLEGRGYSVALPAAAELTARR